MYVLVLNFPMFSIDVLVLMCYTLITARGKAPKPSKLRAASLLTVRV